MTRRVLSIRLTTYAYKQLSKTNTCVLVTGLSTQALTLTPIRAVHRFGICGTRDCAVQCRPGATAVA